MILVGLIIFSHFSLSFWNSWKFMIVLKWVVLNLTLLYFLLLTPIKICQWNLDNCKFINFSLLLHYSMKGTYMVPIINSSFKGLDRLDYILISLLYMSLLDLLGFTRKKWRKYLLRRTNKTHVSLTMCDPYISETCGSKIFVYGSLSSGWIKNINYIKYQTKKIWIY